MTQAFNLSQFANKVNTSGQADLTTAVTGTLPVANGGTGITSAGSNGNVLTSNGTVWTSAALPAGGVTSLNGQTGAITDTSYGAIGSYVAAYGASATAYSAGSTIAGSSLNKASNNNFGGFNFITVTTGTAAGLVPSSTTNLVSLSLSGTWRTMTTGGTSVPSAGYAQLHLWVRIS
jgi:hypothetical protein